MATKHNLKHSIIIETHNNKQGSFNTRAARQKRLFLIADQLISGGYKIAHIKQLKLKHAQFLVGQWLQQGLSAGTVKNRMTDLRWVMQRYGKADQLPTKNDDFNIPRRKYVTNTDKSTVVTDGDLNKITDTDVKMSLILQRAFGLRREESIKIRLHDAVVGDELQLKGGWCKNGKPRSIKIQYPEQWEAIDIVKEHLGKINRALIPADRTYIQQQNTYDLQTHRAGMHKLHGLRHNYVHKRYFDLTGQQCPAKGGKIWRELNSEERRLDQLARLQISLDLGHERRQILAVYCGL